MLAVVGCTTVYNAREAQKEIAPKGWGGAVKVEQLRLSDDSLERLVAFAMTNRPALVAKRLAVVDARLALKELAADAPVLSGTPWTAPKVSVSGGYSESSGGTKLSDHNWRTSGNPSAAVSFDLLLWDFGRYGARASQQAERVLAAEFDLVDAGYAVFGEVSLAYFNFMESRALLEVALTNQIQYAEHVRRAEARLDAGEANKLDVLKARLDLANAAQVTVAASNRVSTTGAILMCALGVEAARGTSDVVFGQSLPGLSFVHQAFPATDYSVDVAFGEARTNAPAMQVKRAQLRASAHAVDYAIADLLPSVSASASLNWVDPFWYFSWGVSAAQSVFQGFRKTTAVNRAVVAMRQSAAAVDVAEQLLSEQLETAVANRDNSVSAVASARASVRSAKENLDMVQEQLELGDVSRIELSDAISAYSQAVGDSITAFYDGQRAEAKLFALLGSYPAYEEKTVKGE